LQEQHQQQFHQTHEQRLDLVHEQDLDQHQQLQESEQQQTLNQQKQLQQVQQQEQQQLTQWKEQQEEKDQQQQQQEQQLQQKEQKLQQKQQRQMQQQHQQLQQQQEENGESNEYLETPFNKTNNNELAITPRQQQQPREQHHQRPEHLNGEMSRPNSAGPWLHVDVINSEAEVDFDHDFSGQTSISTSAWTPTSGPAQKKTRSPPIDRRDRQSRADNPDSFSQKNRQHMQLQTQVHPSPHTHFNQTRQPLRYFPQQQQPPQSKPQQFLQDAAQKRRSTGDQLAQLAHLTQVSAMSTFI
jgi:hypothetical protein